MAIIQTGMCLMCHKTGTVEIPDEAVSRFKDWRAGKGHIQNLLPELSAGDREQLMTGTHDACFDAMFAGE